MNNYRRFGRTRFFRCHEQTILEQETTAQLCLLRASEWFLFELFFNPEDGWNMYHRNAG
jgi:hypothetical protein